VGHPASGHLRPATAPAAADYKLEETGVAGVARETGIAGVAGVTGVSEVSGLPAATPDRDKHYTMPVMHVTAALESRPSTELGKPAAQMRPASTTTVMSSCFVVVVVVAVARCGLLLQTE